MATDLLGHWGENLAAEYLQKKGYSLVAANFRCRMGEIDLIVKKRNRLVFVEVKLRKNADFAEALEYVHNKKQLRLKAAASVYLYENADFDGMTRFDVIEIYAPEGIRTKNPEIRHLEDAFQ